MNAEALVWLLEEHIADLRQSLEKNAWQSFVQALARVSSNVAPRREALESWADRVVDLLMGYSYTKGLLQGLRLGADVRFRSAPMSTPCPDDSGSAVRIPPPRPDEDTLVTRIKAVVKKAQVLV